MRQGLAEFEQQTGVNLREDLLESLGDTWRVFAQPGPGGADQRLDDRDPGTRSGEAGPGPGNVGDSGEEGNSERAGPGTPVLRAETVDGHTVHTLAFDQPGIPMAPSWCLTDNELFIAASPQTLNPLLSGGSGRSLAQRRTWPLCWPTNAKTLALVYVDTSEVVRNVLPFVPAFLQTLGPGVPDVGYVRPSSVRRVPASPAAIDRRPAAHGRRD